MSYLKAHLERYSEQKTSSGRFAGYCIKVLKRCLGKPEILCCRQLYACMCFFFPVPKNLKTCLFD